MSEIATTPDVALLFADAGLGTHLREALTELGARIVHEGPAADVSGDALAASGADVVVVNLEPIEEAHLEQIYAALDGPYQIIFNDAEASRNLTGWDRARWARHLAAKLVGSTDVDPPRPADGRVVEAMASDAGEPVAANADDGANGGGAAPDEVPAAAAARDPAADALDAMASQQMAAELEQLLADDGPLAVGTDASSADGSAPDVSPGAAAAPGEGLHVDVAVDAATPEVAIEERTTIGEASSVADWDLVDFDAAPPPAASPQDDAREFGVEKMRPEDYLAPDSSVNDSPVEPGLDLELVSLEESVAPAMFDEAASEMVLGEGMGGIRRVVVVGAGAECAADAAAFMAALPTELPALVVVVQHQHEQPLDEIVTALDVATPWPVRVAHDGTAGRHGQAWMVPAGQTCHLGRDGVVKLDAIRTTVLGNPSIDECLMALVESFGVDVTAIVLAGAGYDALAGAQEVHDRGGRVWVQDPVACGEDGMATAIHAEGLATFTGAPEELARHLGEEFA